MWTVFIGAWAGTAEIVEHGGVQFQVVRADLGAHRVDLVGQGEGRDGTLANAVSSFDDRTVVAATNAGMYLRDRSPVGLHVERGTVEKGVVRKARGGNFGLLPNGVFVIEDGEARVVATPEWTGATASTWLATQSGPLLVRNGVLHPALNPDGTSRKIRSGVGVTEAGQVVLALSLEPVRFHDFATLFRDALGCPDALFLDGTISSMWVDGKTVGSEGVRYSGVLVVTEDAVPASRDPDRTGP